jgi:hypothetical protein
MNFPMSKVAQTVCWALTPISSPFLIVYTNMHEHGFLLEVCGICFIMSSIAVSRVAKIW